MKKKLFLLTILLTTTLFGKVTIGEPLKPFTLEDQFENKHTLTKDIKKIIFAFSKENGHIMKAYMQGKAENFLSSKDITFIADISKMPSIISYLFAKPDMRESKYPILLIEDEEFATNYKVEEKTDQFMIVELENLIVKDLKFIKTQKELQNFIESK